MIITYECPQGKKDPNAPSFIPPAPAPVPSGNGGDTGGGGDNPKGAIQLAAALLTAASIGFVTVYI